MSQRNSIEEDAHRKNYKKPYGGKHPIPTIQGYRQHRKEIEEQYGSPQQAQEEEDDDSRPRRAYDSAKTILRGEDDTSNSRDPYPVANMNDEERPKRPDTEKDDNVRQSQTSKRNDKSATEQAAGAIDPKDKRKAMKKHKPGGGREVTDPVTHLPIVIYDKTDQDLNDAPENEPAPGTHPRTATGLSNKSKTREQLGDEQQEIQRSYNGLQKTFPPPSFKSVEKELASVYKLALTVGLSAVVGLAAIAVIVTRLLHSAGIILSTFVLAIVVGTGAFLTYSISGWVDKKVKGVWEDETWEALRSEEAETLDSDAELPESVHWLNSILSSVWPLINPDLFSSLVDMLEDVMQASLPKVVRMVSIDDMGQGSESIRILGIKWLPTGAASHSVDDEGNLESTQSEETTDRTTPSEGQQDQSAAGDKEVRNKLQQPDDNKSSEAEKKQQEQSEEAMRAGMEAEEGDFVNVEIAFAYRARSSGKTIKSKAKNAHLYLKFYLPGGIALPVWVELRGIMGVMRARLQLTPDPPFFSVCTFTFLGQPKADLSCIPLSKHSLNIMDVPLISGFVQSAIDAALAEYVAPKSMTIDLKDMLMGEDYKKDTSTRGVVWIYIKQARDFKQGDGGIGPFTEGSSDAYVTVSWGKFGKPVASTRIIVSEQAPNWHEWASILVSPDELNANERLRLQLWDSDKWTADDDLGRVEVDLHELMNDPKTKNKMNDREDRFKAVDLEEEMPGSLTWSVGYFEKTRITDLQLQQQNYKEDIRNKQQLKEFVSKLAERKLREANIQSGHDDELHQQKVQDYKEQEDNMIISAPPSKEHVSGILSMQIHNITGLEVQKQNKEDEDEGDHPDTESGTEGQLPDSYCTIIMNHVKIYKTRTKPRNGKPFFNAGTERFVRDWTTTEIIVSVRDSREKENDALLGVIYMPLRKLFEHRSQFMETFPLVGGVGYGRARISMVWRSVELQLSPNLKGWDYGTLEITNSIHMKGDTHNDLEGDRLKLRTNLSKVKMTFGNGKWQSKRRTRENDESVFLAVRKRYASALMIEFRKNKLGPDSTPGFCVLWLSELTDNEEQTMTLPIFRGGKKNLARAESCCDYKGLEDDGEKLGDIELTLRFWNGLSGYHKSHAQKSKNTDVRNVMECLDTINDEDMGDLYSDTSDSDSDSDNDTEHRDGISQSDRPGTGDSKEEATRKKLRTNTNKSKNSDDDSGIESNEDNGFAKVKAPITKMQDLASKVTDKLVGDQELENDGSRGLRAQAADYKKNHKELHRKHRGLMQFKPVRTLDWAGGKAKRAKSKVGEMFEHSEKDQGIETEV